MKSAITVFFMFLSSVLTAQPGSLDSTFSGNGVTTVNFRRANGIALQQDGKIILGGSEYDNGYFFALARLKTNGELDSTFDNDGIVTTEFVTEDHNIEALAIQSDGKIIAAGRAYYNVHWYFAIARYNTDGSVDSSYGTNGLVLTKFLVNGGIDHAFAVVLQPDGKSIAVGTCGTNGDDLGIARYNIDGSIDSTFNYDGKATYYVGSNDIQSLGAAIQADGKLVVATYLYYDYLLLRYNTNGSPDSSFNDDGVIITSIVPFDNYGFAVAIQSDGAIVEGGHCGDYADHTLVRYSSNGVIDSSFGMNGIASCTFDPNNPATCVSVGIQTDGKIITSGPCYGGFGIACFYPDGSLDNSFGDEGKIKIHIGTDPSADHIGKIVVQPDDKILLFGYYYNDVQFEGRAVIARFKPDTSQVMCSAYFSLFPDSSIPHHYWAVNMATGIQPISYLWSWGDSTYDSIAYPSHTYAYDAQYDISLTTHDSVGCGSTYFYFSYLERASSEQALNTIISVDVVDSIPNFPTSSPAKSVLQSWSVFPNPASQNAFVNYTLSIPATVIIDVNDLLGNKLQVVNAEQEAGEHLLKIDTKKLSSGIYFLQIQAGDQIESQKMVVLHTK